MNAVIKIITLRHSSVEKPMLTTITNHTRLQVLNIWCFSCLLPQTYLPSLFCVVTVCANFCFKMYVYLNQPYSTVHNRRHAPDQILENPQTWAQIPIPQPTNTPSEHRT